MAVRIETMVGGMKSPLLSSKAQQLLIIGDEGIETITTAACREAGELTLATIKPWVTIN
jgi:hypothetical protein